MATAIWAAAEQMDDGCLRGLRTSSSHLYREMVSGQMSDVSLSLSEGQRVVLDACPGYDINNVRRAFYGEWLVDHINPHEVGLRPLTLDRYVHPEDQLVFVNFPLPPAHHFWIDNDIST